MDKIKIFASRDITESFVELNGQRLRGVTEVRFKLTADSKVPSISLDIIGEIEIDGVLDLEAHPLLRVVDEAAKND